MGEHSPAVWTGSGKSSVPAHGTTGDSGGGQQDEIDATDAAKALAAEHGIDLKDVKGTGTDGRVTKDDVEATHASWTD